MSIQEKIASITASRDILKQKVSDLGLGDGTDKLAACAEKIKNIKIIATFNEEVTEGNSVNIEPGYYKGGTVTGVAGGGNYELYDPPTVTPTKSVQTITPNGKYGIRSVTVDAIPQKFQNVEGVTAKEEYVLSPYTFMDIGGVLKTGSIGSFNNFADTFNGLTDPSYTIPKGYHDGKGVITLTNDIETALEAI